MLFNKKIIQKNFDRSSSRYQEYALVQKIVAKDLVKQLAQLIDIKKISNQRIIDLGSGSGFIFLELIKMIDKNNFFYQTDLSSKMLELSSLNLKNNYKICCDIENLPFKKNSFDLALSSFTIQWLNQPQKFFQNLYQIINRNGLVAIAIPTNQSLNQLKSLNLFRLNPLPDSDEIIKNIKTTDFKLIAVKEASYQEFFCNSIEAIKSFKKIGSNYQDFEKKSQQINIKHLLNSYRKSIKKNLHNFDHKFTITWIVKFYFLQKNDCK